MLRKVYWHSFSEAESTSTLLRLESMDIGIQMESQCVNACFENDE